MNLKKSVTILRKLLSAKNTKRKPPVLPILRAFAFIEYHIFLPMAIIAYAENEINILLWMIISINLDRIENHFIGSILIFKLLLRNNFE